MTAGGTQKDAGRPLVGVSACLLGLNTRYDGGNCHRPNLLRDLEPGRPIPFCPEQLGGLPTPRPPAEITRGDGAEVLEGEAAVATDDGCDVTDSYLRGARQVRLLAQKLDIQRAYLKEGSPACGVTCIMRNDSEVPGRGVAAALLVESGVEVTGIP